LFNSLTLVEEQSFIFRIQFLHTFEKRFIAKIFAIEAFTVTSRSKTIAALRLCVLDGNATAGRFFDELSKKRQF
jgi:hypothetical protein